MFQKDQMKSSCKIIKIYVESSKYANHVIIYRTKGRLRLTFDAAAKIINVTRTFCLNGTSAGKRFESPLASSLFSVEKL